MLGAEVADLIKVQETLAAVAEQAQVGQTTLLVETLQQTLVQAEAEAGT
jgi:hypothetical protein